VRAATARRRRSSARDGRWYVSSFAVARPGADPNPYAHGAKLSCPELPGTLVLRNEPVAEALVRFAIRKMLAGGSASDGGDGPRFVNFMARLNRSRFAKAVLH
jgi:hypothetical protein